MHYVIGDVHGCFDEMMTLINKIERKDKNARFIFVGDFMDRGPKVWDTLMWMMENITTNGKYQSVCGNHEDMIISWYNEWHFWWEQKQSLPKGQPFEPAPRTDFDFFKWCKNMNYLYPPKLDPIIDFLKSLPYEIDLNVNGVDFHIVHAGCPPVTYELYDDIKRQYALWHRRSGGYPKGDKIVVHGHTPTFISDEINPKGAVPGMISYDKFDINVDGGCVFGGMYPFPCMLCAIRLEDLKEFYPRSLEERIMQIAKVPMDDELLKQECDSFREDYFREISYRTEMLEMIRKSKKNGKAKD